MQISVNFLKAKGAAPAFESLIKQGTVMFSGKTYDPNVPTYIVGIEEGLILPGTRRVRCYLVTEADFPKLNKEYDIARWAGSLPILKKLEKKTKKLEKKTKKHG